MASSGRRMGHPFTVAEFSELVSLALEDCDPGRRLFSSPPPRSVLSRAHRPPPMHPLGAPSHLDLSHTCMSLQSPSSRPKARQVFAKLKQQASALVRAPTVRLRSRSCTEDDARTLPLRPAPTVTFAASAPRARSASYLSYASTATTSSLPDASLSSDFVPYVPLAIRLERESHTGSSLSDKRSVVPPPSPSSSMRSISTMSTQSPVTPVFTHHHNHDAHPHASAAAVMSSPFSTPSDDPDNQNNDSFSKAKVQIVRRSLVQDSFMLACAAVDDDGGVNRSPKKSRRPANAPLPPVKPPPSCPLPSPPPLLASAVSISSLSAPELVTADEEWTLFLGAPSKPLELAKEHVRERAKSTPSAPFRSKNHHLSPPDTSAQFKEPRETESARTRTVSTRSMATTRRIESGPGDQCFEDWTLSLPLPRKSGTSSEKATTSNSLEVPVEPKTRKCKSFTDWTTSLSEEYEMEERRLAEREQRERERERKLSRVSLVSTKSARASVISSSSVSIRSSTKVKKQLPIGPGSNDSRSISTNPAATTSAISLHSVASAFSTPSNKRSAPVTPVSPSFIDSIWANSPQYTLRQEQALASSASTSVSTLGRFPLPPPSYSSKLLQRRQGVPSMPRPLMPPTSFVLRKQFGSPTSYVFALPPTSAPASSSSFPAGVPSPTTRTPLGVPSPLRRTRSYGPTVGTTNDVSVTRWNSSKTTSSNATVKMPSSNKPNDDGAGVDESAGEDVAGKSSGECYETCDEGGLSPVAPSFQAISEAGSMRSSSEFFYSARSSMNM